jgi:hypothetical protein
MSEYIDRFDTNRKSIVNDIYKGVENGTIKIQAVEIADGRRLDHYAQKYYGNGLNYWIIAAASGIRWPMGIGAGNANKDSNQLDGIALYIPELEDILRLKNR